MQFVRILKQLLRKSFSLPICEIIIQKNLVKKVTISPDAQLAFWGNYG